MSRYVLLTENENLEVFTGFDAGMGGFFLTIADARTCTGEAGSYLFHNLDHHPGVGMTLDEVERTLENFGIIVPPDLADALYKDAVRVGAHSAVKENVGDAQTFPETKIFLTTNSSLSKDHMLQVLRWEAI